MKTGWFGSPNRNRGSSLTHIVDDNELPATPAAPALPAQGGLFE